jgi:DNA topoisomerase-1
VDPASIDLEQGVELLREREARGPAKKRTAKKTAKKTTKKTTKKKAAKKKAPPIATHVVKKGTSKRARAHKAAQVAASSNGEPDGSVPVIESPNGAEPDPLSTTDDDALA